MECRIHLSTLLALIVSDCVLPILELIVNLFIPKLTIVVALAAIIINLGVVVVTLYEANQTAD